MKLKITKLLIKEQLKRLKEQQTTKKPHRSIPDELWNSFDEMQRIGFYYWFGGWGYRDKTTDSDDSGNLEEQKGRGNKLMPLGPDMYFFKWWPSFWGYGGADAEDCGNLEEQGKKPPSKDELVSAVQNSSMKPEYKHPLVWIILFAINELTNSGWAPDPDEDDSDDL